MVVKSSLAKMLAKYEIIQRITDFNKGKVKANGIKRCGLLIM